MVFKILSKGKTRNGARSQVLLKYRSMRQIEEFADERQKAWCIHCTGVLAYLEMTRDHVPTKGLLRQPYPENVPVIPVCKQCNNDFSRDEEYFVAFLGCVFSGSTDPDAKGNAHVARTLRRSPKLRALIERSCADYKTIGGDTRRLWKPDSARINRVVLKNARGHAFFELAEPIMSAPEYVWSMPLSALTKSEREDFENIESGNFWPEVGSRMLTRAAGGHDLSGPWVIVQQGIYRYALAQAPLRVRTVIHEYLATEVCWDE
jgi:hypothetical protein